MKTKLFILTFSLLIEFSISRVLLGTGAVRLRHSPSKFKGLLSDDFKVLMERRLKELREFIPNRTFLVAKKDNYKKLSFMKIIANILKEAKRRNLKIKSVKLGKKIREIFENKDISKIMTHYLNDPDFMRKYEKEIKKSQVLDRKMRQIKIRNRKIKENAKFRRLKNKKSKMNFQMSGDISQMPFPPMVMNGPHYHPPMNITVNQLPNMNPRSERNPIELQLKAFQSQTDQLRDILKTMNDGPRKSFEELKSEVDQKLAEGFNSIKDKALA